MKTRLNFAVLLILLIACTVERPDGKTASATWPDSIPWWKANNLRVIQTNLPAYEGGLNPDSLIEDLKHFSANTLIINAGGIMAFYPTKLQYQYINPHMNPTMLGSVIEKCHANGIRVIVRFDFSRAHKSIFEKHPDWFYISPEGERIINDDMVVVSINAPYEQEQLFNIVGEVIEMYPVDGIFINMPGYQTRNPYVGKYHGIDQNPYDQKRFTEFSEGMKLPVKEDPSDTTFQKYIEFKKYTTEDLMARLHKLVKGKNDQIAICTYSEKFVDIIRHESQTNSLPYWPYNASDNVNNTRTSYPHHIVSNASIQQISFNSRYNAVEPEEVFIRLYENIAQGSGLDMSMMGDFQDYEDERNYDVFREVYAHHKKFEMYCGRYKTTAEVAVVSPGSWPAGETAQEYRGIQLMLKESHIQHDLIEDSQIGNLGEELKRYKVVILPDILRLDSKAMTVLFSLVKQGTNLIATNRTLTSDSVALMNLFGARPAEIDHDGTGFYLAPGKNSIFKRLRKQKLISWKFNLGLYEFPQADTFLSIYTPGCPGPPEIIGGHIPTSYYALGIRNHEQGKAALIPGSLGRLYYLHGYEQNKNILLDILDYVNPGIGEVIKTNAPPRVEVILQRYNRNIPENLNANYFEGLALHLVNLTGFSGNTYFEPLPVNKLSFEIKCDFEPKSVFTLVSNKEVKFNWKDGAVTLLVDELNRYETVVINK